MEESIKKTIKALEYFYKAEKGDARTYHLNSCRKLLVSVLQRLNGSMPEDVTEEIKMAIEHVDYFSSNALKYFNSPKYFFEHMSYFFGWVHGIN